MTITIDSAATSALYCTAAEVWPFVDARTMADLCSASGARLGSSTDVASMQAALGSNANFLSNLYAANGELETACLVSKAYTAADLAVIASSGKATAYYLKRLVARLLCGPVWM